ncbi:MAG TPA: hypothetical protein VMH84_12745, partial [Xanthobacteraceae bacterium]|nr:hypothetical protein [Xanthobacteraceae bacterium]
MTPPAREPMISLNLRTKARIPLPSPWGDLGGLRGARREPKNSLKRGALKLPAEPQRPGGIRMTAEVAVLNKLGVALAADSTVTIATINGDKTYNTANKLFTLSKHHPIGIMIWNGTELNTVPFELIIKEFREALGKKSKRSVKEYANAFVRYLRTKAHVTKNDQEYNFKSILTDFCRSIREQFYEKCREEKISIPQPRLTGDALRAFSLVLDEFEKNIQSSPRNRNLKNISANRLASIYPGVVTKIADDLFARIKPSSAQLRRFVKLLHEAVLRDIVSDDFAGIVIAGYGSQEFYPSLVSYQTDGIFANRLKLITKDPAAITRQNPAILAPFAQREAANLFMEGVDGSYQEAIDESVSDLIIGLADVSANYFGIQNSQKINKFRTDLKEMAEKYVKVLREARYD